GHHPTQETPRQPGVRGHSGESAVGEAQDSSTSPEPTGPAGTSSSAALRPPCAQTVTLLPRSAPALPTGRCEVTTPSLGASAWSGPTGTRPARVIMTQASSASKPTTSGTSVTGCWARILLL